MKGNCTSCGKEATRKLEIGSDEGFLLCCDSKKCFEKIEEEIYNTHYMEFNQGRKYSSYKSSANIVYYSVFAMIILLAIYTIAEIVNKFLI